MKRLLILLGVAGFVSLTSCTEQELAEWVAWHERDPEAAIASLPKLRNVQGDGVWNTIARCESGGRCGLPPSNEPLRHVLGWVDDRPPLVAGARWHRVRPVPVPRRTRAEQIHIAEKIVDAQGLDRGWQCWHRDDPGHSRRQPSTPS